MGADKYGIIIASHEPKIEILMDLLIKLSKKGITNIFLIDSSRSKTSKNIQSSVEQLNKASVNQIIFYKKIKNQGVGDKYNFGFQLCLESQCNIITILTDDAIINEETFNPNKIADFFTRNLDPRKDILALNSWDSRDYGRLVEIKVGPDFGMTLSNSLIKNIKFKEDLILDYTDIDFCSRIKRNGGKIKLYPEETVTSIPSGSKTNENSPHLPSWRIYLVIRNYLTLSYEYRDLFFFIYNTYRATKYMIISLIRREKFLSITKAAIFGLLDAKSRKLGITNNLQRLSNNFTIEE